MKLLCLIICLLPSSGFSKNFLESHETGWFWYEKIPEKSKKQKEDAPPQATPSATQSMALLQQRISESLNRAILSPTDENLLDYANTYYQVIHQGQQFTNGYKMMLLKYPKYDYYLRFPVNHQARLIQERQINQSQQKAVKNLAATHGFLFFYSTNCQYCQTFAPTVKRFAARYGIHVMAISMDGGLLPEFRNAVPNNGIAKTLGVTSWPALFAVNPKTHQVIPLSNGMVSLTELEETIFKYVELAKNHTP